MSESSGENARRLTEPQDEYAVEDQDFPDGMLGLFGTRFRVWWHEGGYQTFTDFTEARKAVHPEKGPPARIDRIEIVWLHKDLMRDE